MTSERTATYGRRTEGRVPAAVEKYLRNIPPADWGRDRPPVKPWLAGLIKLG